MASDVSPAPSVLPISPARQSCPSVLRVSDGGAPCCALSPSVRQLLLLCPAAYPQAHGFKGFRVLRVRKSTRSARGTERRLRCCRPAWPAETGTLLQVSWPAVRVEDDARTCLCSRTWASFAALAPPGPAANKPPQELFPAAAVTAAVAVPRRQGVVGRAVGLWAEGPGVRCRRRRGGEGRRWTAAVRGGR